MLAQEGTERRKSQLDSSMFPTLYHFHTSALDYHKTDPLQSLRINYKLISILMTHNCSPSNPKMRQHLTGLPK